MSGQTNTELSLLIPISAVLSAAYTQLPCSLAASPHAQSSQESHQMEGWMLADKWPSSLVPHQGILGKTHKSPKAPALLLLSISGSPRGCAENAAFPLSLLGTS